jgi:tRNA(Ile)-lysidine synthase
MNLQEAKKLENKIRKILKQHLKPKTTVVAGISGGPDSIFLLNSLTKIPNLKIITAHINHCLRGKESDADENFVEKYVEELNKNLPEKKSMLFYSKKINITSKSRKSKKGIEETARHERYKFFKSLSKKYNADFIITAHHADDNLETILLNFTRGATLQGLSGMQEIDTVPYSKSSTLLFRPLLSITKNQILLYLKSKRIPFKIDKSNFSQQYNRNLIRNKIVPQLTKINPNIAQTTAKNTSLLRKINEFLNQQAQNWINRHAVNPRQKRGRTKCHLANFDFPAKAFRALHPALQKAILRQLHHNLAGHTQNLENTHIHEALKIINNNIGNKQKKMGKLTLRLKKNIFEIK